MGTRLNNSHETLIWATKSEKSKYTFNYKTAKELNTDTVEKSEFDKGIRKQLGSVWKISLCQGNERLKNDKGEKLHSTQKPEELLRRIIAISSNINDLVFDPFGGTMTTAAVAKKMGRRYITIEKEPEYCMYGQKRLDEVVEEIGDIERAVFDIKPLKVTLPEMIENNYLIEGETFYLKNNIPGGKLLRNGKLFYNNEEIDIHTCAAIVKNVKASRLNGFDVWYVMREGTLVSIDKIRENYRKEKSKTK